MKILRPTTAGLLGLASVLLGACNEPARQPTTATAPAPGQPLEGAPGTPSGPRPSNEALNAPAQTTAVPLNPTEQAAAAADSASIGPADKSAPFVGKTGAQPNPGKSRPSPANTRTH
ncbi:hypothetical protein ACFQ48_10900 [Hymenobacter caeli]|uniref:Lipoprotein n=1 Tax=Hymenobacter caeli TaxID=2735894 RepID=A0ABX2FSE8_9BACT|nr:hypothetical protein [Hymenobacter caeli]NRT19931.1 hypothetical protein [Hymenobacter caeli]